MSLIKSNLLGTPTEAEFAAFRKHQLKLYPWLLNIFVEFKPWSSDGRFGTSLWECMPGVGVDFAAATFYMQLNYPDEPIGSEKKVVLLDRGQGHTVIKLFFPQRPPCPIIKTLKRENELQNCQKLALVYYK